MGKILIKRLPYEEVQFKWISNHYDVHLNGTCLFNGTLHEFENDYPEQYDSEMLVRIYKIDLLTKMRWIWRQWKFEKCIGYHYSYPQRKNGAVYHHRKPEWLYSFLWNWHYKKRK